jgi:hypothetical protein
MWFLLACTPPDDRAKDDAPTAAAHSAAPAPTDSGPTDLPTTPTDPTGGTTGSTGHTGLAGTGGTGASADTGPAPAPEPDFALVDLNPTSPTFGATRSPRDELRKVSGWYFTHAS